MYGFRYQEDYEKEYLLTSWRAMFPIKVFDRTYRQRKERIF